MRVERLSTHLSKRLAKQQKESFFDWFKHEPFQTINIPKAGLNDHVVIAGGGRVGSHVARVLKNLQIDFVIVELDYRRVEEARSAGFPVIYGDAKETIVLKGAEIDKARLLLVTVSSIVIARTIVDRVRPISSQLHIAARAEGLEQMKTLYDADHRFDTGDLVAVERNAIQVLTACS